MAEQAARAAIADFVSVRIGWGEAHQKARAELVAALAEKMAVQALAAIERPLG